MKKFLLHTCCAPCSIVIIEELKDQYDLTVFFYNPNIFPEEEYLKRKKYVIQVCEEWSVKIIDWDYEVEKWNETVKGLENEPEGGARCAVCFKMRLEKTAKYAKENNFDIFSTSLTSGRTKRAEIINPIGQLLADKYGLEYLAEDWKKGGRPTSATTFAEASAVKKATAGKQESRQEKATRLVNERGIYRQNYCGCKYSLKLNYIDNNKK